MWLLVPAIFALRTEFYGLIRRGLPRKRLQRRLPLRLRELRRELHLRWGFFVLFGPYARLDAARALRKLPENLPLSFFITQHSRRARYDLWY